MIPAQAALWSKAAVATAFDLRRRIVAVARDLAQAGRVGRGRARSGMIRARTRMAQAATATRLALGRTAARARAATGQFTAALILHRHGTWLVLFGILFTLLWLLAGWIGIGNGLPRGLLVGILTPLLVNALFPLKRAPR